MKSVLTSVWFINNAIGNLIVVFITQYRPVKGQMMEFFLYSALMFLGICCFKFLSLDFCLGGQAASSTSANESENGDDNNTP